MREAILLLVVLGGAAYLGVIKDVDWRLVIAFAFGAIAIEASRLLENEFVRFWRQMMKGSGGQRN